MRLVVVALSIMLVVAAPAHAGSVAREGAELVFRADPEQDDLLTVARDGEAVRFTAGRDGTVAAGAGCSADEGGARCDLGGATTVRVLLDDGADRLDISGRLPVIADLGEGDDEVYVVDGGTKLSLIGGAGDDQLSVAPGNATAARIECGPGDDRWSAGPGTRVGRGCAPQLRGITPRTVSRVFREGRLTAPASGSVTFRRFSEADGPGTALARAAFARRSGALRLSLRPTSAGRRVLRRNPRPRVLVVVATRAGEEHGETVFASRMR